MGITLKHMKVVVDGTGRGDFLHPTELTVEPLLQRPPPFRTLLPPPSNHAWDCC